MALPEAPEIPPKPSAAPSVRRVRSAALVIGVAITAAFLATALVALFWTPHPFDELDIARRLLPPSWAHPFGTDQIARQVESEHLLLAVLGNQIALYGTTAYNVKRIGLFTFTKNMLTLATDTPGLLQMLGDAGIIE